MFACKCLEEFWQDTKELGNISCPQREKKKALGTEVGGRPSSDSLLHLLSFKSGNDFPF